MTASEHLERHIALHDALDELIADFIAHNRNAHLTTTNLIELMAWSYQQTIHPMEHWESANGDTKRATESH